MRLDRLRAGIRPRTSWEGLDLGFAFGRQWFPALWGIWWLCALPVGAATAIWLPDRPDLWILLVWWLKPLYEAPLLFWLSRAIFGERVSPRGLWRERRRVLPLRLLPSLLWQRFHLSRSFALPLIQLEGLGGRERRRRQRVIQGKGSAAAWLTIICMHLESIIWASALVLTLLLVPDELPRLDASAVLFEVESAAYWIGVVLYWLAMSAMAPFYVGAGFALYLSRRAELEAWDLELVFRRAEGEERGKRRGRAPTALGAAGLLVLTLWTAPTLGADVQPTDPEGARSLISEVLAQEDFGSTREARTWVYVGKPGTLGGDLELPAWVRYLLELFAPGANLVATLAKWLLVLLAAIVGGLALRRILAELRRRESERATVREADDILQRAEATKADDLPADVAARIGTLIAAGDQRAALSLLYRVSLARLVRRHGIEIPVSATETECLALVADARPTEETELLRRLIGTWQRLAYARRPCEAEEIAKLLQDWLTWHGGPGEIRR